MTDPFTHLDILLGMDDIAHNNLLTKKGKKWVKIKNYGKLNPDEICYCDQLKDLLRSLKAWEKRR